jgi:hypothetical protein
MRKRRISSNAGTNSVGVQSEGEAESVCGGDFASPEPQNLQSGFSAKKVRISSNKHH